MIKTSFRYSLMALGLAALSSPLMAATTPLLQEGKKTLYQRVLTTPNCQLVNNAGDKAGKKVPTFSRYYVYARKNIQKSEWLQVGTNTTGKIIGWFDSQCTVPWNMQLTLSFSPSANRDTLLFFKDQASLDNILEAPDMAAAITPIRTDLQQTGKSDSILAQEPRPTVDFNKHFYLLPILQGKEISTKSGHNMRRLEVASVAEQNEGVASAINGNSSNNGSTSPSSSTQQTVTEFTSAFVFVIDSTISMDPYIERTRQAVKKIYEELERKNLGKYAKFGLVAFRSSTKAVPGLEYVSKIFVDPNTVKNSKDFLNKIANLKQATVSSKEFSEDAFAGMETAIDNINWKSFGARHIILITDAGALDSDNPLSSTGMDAKQIRAEADVKGIAIWTLHLKTPAGKSNHAKAGRQYRELSFNDTAQKTLYYQVNAGDVNDFGKKMDELNQILTEQVELAYQGENAAGSALNDTSSSSKSDVTSQIQKDAALVGQAMRLRYIGNASKNHTAPSFFKAWVVDRDFVKTNTPTADVRVLLTRAELNALAEKVQVILDAANVGQVSPTEMFNRLRDIAGATMQDPDQLSTTSKISDMGLLAEYLDDLPYRSEVSNISVEDWKSYTAQDQDRIIRSLKSKLQQYRKYNKEGDDRWHKLSEDSDREDWVYPVPLETLP